MLTSHLLEWRERVVNFAQRPASWMTKHRETLQSVYLIKMVMENLIIHNRLPVASIKE